MYTYFRDSSIATKEDGFLKESLRENLNKSLQFIDVTGDADKNVNYS